MDAHNTDPGLISLGVMCVDTGTGMPRIAELTRSTPMSPRGIRTRHPARRPFSYVTTVCQAPETVASWPAHWQAAAEKPSCTSGGRTMYHENGCLRLFQKASTKILLYLMATGHTVAPRSKAPRLNMTVYSLFTQVPSGNTSSGVAAGSRICSCIRFATICRSFTCTARPVSSHRFELLCAHFPSY